MPADYSFFIKIRLLLSVEGVGPIRVRNLLSKFHKPENIFGASVKNISSVDGISSELATRILRKADDSVNFEKSLENEIHQLEKMGANILTYWSDDYPRQLKNIFDPPLIIYVLGNFSSDDVNSIGVVGTRNPTAYGRLMCERFTEGLTSAGLTIVSGLARGIDSIAHKTAIKHKGRTIGVLGSGLDKMYPPENKKLAEEISCNGAVISEYPLGTGPDAGNFPRRNRIISGLSKGVLVVETATTGGAILTAKLANDHGREVFSVPGNVGVRQSEGTNALIQKGEAKLVTSVEDILTELGMMVMENESRQNTPPAGLSLFEEKIYEALTEGPLHIDRIAAVTGMNVSDCLVYLLMLEFKGCIRQLPGKNFEILH